MAAKITMILFPVGVFLVLVYFALSIASFFIPDETVAVSPTLAFTATDTPLEVTLVATDTEDISTKIEEVSTSSQPITVTTTPLSTKTITPVVSAPVKEVPAKNISSVPLHFGERGDGWSNNSWGVSTVVNKTGKTLDVLYHKPWEALSVYSEGYAINGYRSIEIQLSSSTTANTLHLSMFDGTQKLGGVTLSSYAADETNMLFRIPLTDLMDTSTRLTDIALESDSAQSVAVAEIRFTDVVGVARKEDPILIAPQPVATATGTSSEKAVPLVALATGANVYFGGLQNGWEIVTRRIATIDIMDDENWSVTGKAIKIHFGKPDGSLSFTRKGGIATKDYRYLHLKIYGGVTDHEWQQLVVSLFDASGNKLGTRDVMLYSGNGKILMQTWNSADIPLAELGAADAVVETIDIENANTTQEGDHMWFDDVRFLDN